MVVTRETTVKEVVYSCKAAPELFAKHGVNPQVQCLGMYDMVTLEEAEEWCKLRDLDSLLEELNAAIQAEESARAASGSKKA